MAHCSMVSRINLANWSTLLLKRNGLVRYFSLHFVGRERNNKKINEKICIEKNIECTKMAMKRKQRRKINAKQNEYNNIPVGADRLSKMCRHAVRKTK